MTTVAIISKTWLFSRSQQKTIYNQWRRNEYESGAHVRRKAQEKCFVCPSNSFGFTSTISRFGERFHDGQYSLISLSFDVF